MKRLYYVLTALIISAYSVFGYTILEDFNDFLVDENQLTIRLDRFGVLAGTENLRFMVGVEGETAGVLIDNLTSGIKGGINTFKPATTVGFAYKTESFGIGAGYQFKYISGTWHAHTPIITATALNDNLRINIPVTIGVGMGGVNEGDMAVSTDIRVEYYTGNDIFSRIRVNLQYGMYSMKGGESRMGNVLPPIMNPRNLGFDKDTQAHSIGIDVRGYFIAATDPILIEPQIRLIYKASLKDFKGTSYSVTANGTTQNGAAEFGFYQVDASSPVGGIGEMSGMNFLFEGGSINIGGTEYYITKPQFIGLSVPVGFTAESDLISIYLEPAVSFSMITGGVNSGMLSSKPVRIPPVFYSVGYLVYGELYITPMPNLEWYFEAQIGGATTVDGIGNSADNGLVFNGSTGITWRF